MPIGSSLNITLPTIGATDWATLNADVLQPIIDAIEARITADAIDLSGSLDFQGSMAINLQGLKFVAASDPGTARSMFYNSSGELCVRDGNGDLIQLTSNGAVNISVNGGIGGDYSAGVALVSFSSADSSYTFTSSPGVHSTMETSDVRIHNGSSTGYIGLKAPSGQTNTINYTFPGSHPAATYVMQVDATGTILVGDNHIPNAVTMVSTLGVTGSAAFKSSVGVSGTLTVGQTGSFAVVKTSRDNLHTNTYTVVVGAASAAMSSSVGLNGPYFDNTNGDSVILPTASSVGVSFPWTPKVGDRLVSWTAYSEKLSAGVSVMTGQMRRVNASAGAAANIGGPSNSLATTAKHSFSSASLDYTAQAGEQYSLRLTTNGSGFLIYHVTFTYDRPTGSV